jgi:hypothetical protein
MAADREYAWQRRGKTNPVDNLAGVLRERIQQMTKRSQNDPADNKARLLSHRGTLEAPQSDEGA